VTALDPGDFAVADEAEHADRDGGGDWDTGDPPPLPALSCEHDGPHEVLASGLRRCESCGEVLPCTHPAHARRLIDGEQVCTLAGCGEVLDAPLPAIVPRDRPGVDPTYRLGGTDAGEGGLRHMTYDPRADLATRPYTPDEVERELVDTVDRLERGASWLTTKEEERAAAKLAYELAHARAIFTSKGRSAEQREAEALLATRREYEDWQLLELSCRTAREGLHNLRSKGSYLQTISRSVGDALRGGPR